MTRKLVYKASMALVFVIVPLLICALTITTAIMHFIYKSEAATAFFLIAACIASCIWLAGYLALLIAGAVIVSKYD